MSNPNLSLGVFGLVLSHSLHAPPPPPLFLFLVSIGGESLAVAQNTYAVNWFKGKELNLVFGLQLSMARLVRTLPADHEVIHALKITHYVRTQIYAFKSVRPPLHSS